MNIFKDCPILIFDLVELTKYCIRWYWIIEETEKIDVVKKWIDETNYKDKNTLLDWLKTIGVDSNKSFIEIVGKELARRDMI